MDEKQFKEAQEQLAKLTADNARLQEALVLRDARDFVAAELAKSTLPELTKTRLAGQLAANPPLKEGAVDKDAYAARIAEAVKAETEYLQAVAGYGAGRIEGMGSGQQQQRSDDGAADLKRMTEAFVAMGYSEAEAKIAATGRAW